MLPALLAGLILGLCKMDMFFGYSYLSRPIIASTLMGLVLGDLTLGIIIGGVLEVIFIGSFPVGAAVAPDGAAAGVIGTAFAVITHSDASLATALAVPIGLLGGFLFILVKLFNSVFTTAMGSQLKKNELKNASRIYVIGCWVSTFGIYFLFGALAVYSGSGAVKALVNAIPVNVINALSASANLLPAIGFAILLKMIISKKMAPYFFIGFMLAAYLKLPTIAITLFAVAIVLLILVGEKPQSQASSVTGEDVDDDDF
ncbi:PTS mannose/fructose/sorbose/N-acetylgalactosamine transporter subunit IIC [Lacticaseibacillus baoqingensis]|uniref:PTS mannose/fructose/sorbose/N-acetylgalactosamine transporter subunit IIC n=1 Tax=Lacticaseibacillus baoqingensis TaxID=2486013 RepID=A0ABW4ECY9_9LACO|nr:PTS sugar transporter subunit IIC [Lacticaseibacillus baoqingensis]